MIVVAMPVLVTQVVGAEGAVLTAVAEAAAVTAAAAAFESSSLLCDHQSSKMLQRQHLPSEGINYDNDFICIMLNVSTEGSS